MPCKIKSVMLICDLCGFSKDYELKNNEMALPWSRAKWELQTGAERAQAQQALEKIHLMLNGMDVEILTTDNSNWVRFGLLHLCPACTISFGWYVLNRFLDIPDKYIKCIIGVREL